MRVREGGRDEIVEAAIETTVRISGRNDGVKTHGVVEGLEGGLMKVDNDGLALLRGILRPILGQGIFEGYFVASFME